MVCHLSQSHNGVLTPKRRSGKETHPHTAITAATTTSGGLWRRRPQATALLRSQVLRKSEQGLCAWRILQGHFEEHIQRHACILSATALHVEIKTAHEGVALCIRQSIKLKVHE